MKNKAYYKDTLRSLSSKRLFKYDFVGFDIETHGTNNDFVMGGLYWYEGTNKETKIYKYFYNRREMIDFVLSYRFKGKYIVATNLDFDLTKLFYKTKEWNELEKIEVGSTLKYASHSSHNHKKKGKTKFIDTTNYLFTSVEKLGNIIGVKKLEKPSCWKKKRDEEGNEYYEVNKPRNYSERKELEEYNKYDCKISCDFMYFLQEGINRAGGKLCITIASTSFDVWRRGYLKTILEKEQRVTKDPNINEHIFKGYYGGRTEVYKRGKTNNIYYYDINSLYPSVMREEYPLPNSAKKIRHVRKQYINDYEGVSEVLVDCPYMNKPFLPYKDEKTKKLIFPYGTFKGTYNHNELRKALSLGYTIKKVYTQLIYTEQFSPFKDFVNYFYEERNKYKKQDSMMEIPMKLIMNSLYGKFGQKKITKNLMIDIEPLSYEELDKILFTNDKAIIKNGFVIQTKDEAYNGKNTYPILASYTTSKARILMYDYLNHPSVVYTDTDSIMTDQNLNIDSKQLGKMKLEGFFRSVEAYKPKTYALDHEQKGFTIKMKGINKANKQDFDGVVKGKSITKFKLTRLKESVRQGIEPYSQATITKNLSLLDDKRNWRRDNMSDPIKKDYYMDEQTKKALLEQEEIKKQTAILREQKKRTKDLTVSDLFDSESIGEDISIEEYLRNETKDVMLE